MIHIDEVLKLRKYIQEIRKKEKNMTFKELIKGINKYSDILVSTYEDNGDNSVDIYEGIIRDIPEIILENAELNEDDYLYHEEDYILIYINPNEELEHWVKHKDDPIEEPNDTPEELERIAEEEKNLGEAMGAQIDDNLSVAQQILNQLKLMNKMYFYKNYKSYTWSDEKEWDNLAEEFEKEIKK